MAKIKLKTNKAAKKRFKITAKGKIKMNKQARRHLLTDKSTSRKRKLRRSGIACKSDELRIKSLLPYG